METNGVVPRGWQAWVTKLHELANRGRNLKWEIGDHLNDGEARFHDRIWQVLNDTGWSRAYIANVQYVSRRIPPDERTTEIGWSLYQAMAPLEPSERSRLITRALRGEIDRQDIRRIVAQNGSNGLGTQMAGMSEGLPTAREQAKIDFSNAMLVCVKLMKYGDEENLKQGLDELIEKAMALKEHL